MIVVEHLNEHLNEHTNSKSRKNTMQLRKKKKRNRRNNDKHRSMPSLKLGRHRMVAPKPSIHSKSDEDYFANKKPENSDNNDNNDPHLIEVYQSFNNTRYHSLVKINDKHMPTPKRETNIYNNNIQNNTNQIPFISEELSSHSRINSMSSYPSILALKLSFTNQASSDEISILSQKNNITTMQNGEIDVDDAISCHSSFYNNSNEYDGQLKPISSLLLPLRKNNGLKLKQDYQTSNKTSNKTPKLNKHLLSGTDMSSLLDHEDAFDPPQPSRHNSYQIHPMLQSVVEEVITDKNISKISDASLEFKQYKKRQQEFNKIINKNKKQIQQNKMGDINININNNYNTYNDKKHTKTQSTSLIITSNKNKNKNKNKRHNFEIKRPKTSRININKYKKQDDMRLFMGRSISSSSSSISSSSSSNSSSICSSNSINTSSSSSSISNTIPINNNDIIKRPVKIIRRKPEYKITNISRATSTAITVGSNKHKQKKYGLFDDENSKQNIHKPIKFRHEAKENDLLSEWELMERNKFVLGSKLNTFGGTSDVTNMQYEENILNKLTVDNNTDHKLCKKEVHDAYERGFLAGYFLGVNIMQQKD